jgi:hypothetical protein
MAKGRKGKRSAPKREDVAATARLAEMVRARRWQLGSLLAFLGIFSLYTTTLPWWASETMGTVTAIGATPADPNMNRPIVVQYTAPNGEIETTNTFEAGQDVGKLQRGNPIPLYVWPFPPYSAKPKEVVAHARAKWHVLSAIWLALAVAFVGLVAHGRVLARRMA